MTNKMIIVFFIFNVFSWWVFGEPVSTLLNFRTFEYNTEGKKIKESLFLPNNVLTSYMLYLWQDSNLVQIRNFNDAGINEGKIINYYNTQNRKIKTEFIVENGHTSSYKVYHYNTQNLLVEVLDCDTNGTVISIDSLYYDVNSHIIKEKWVSLLYNVINVSVFINDSTGVPIRINNFSSTTLRSYNILIYDSLHNPISRTFYNSDGQLTSQHRMEYEYHSNGKISGIREFK